MILVLSFLILKFFVEANTQTVSIRECHNGGVEKDPPDRGDKPRRPVPSTSACRDNDRNGLCNALFPNDAIATSLNP